MLQVFNPASYEFRARTRPILFISLPLALSIWAWTSGPLDGLSWILSMVVAAGVPYVLGEWASDRGRAQEQDLWQSWGGAPTTQLLRHRDSRLNPYTRRQVHAALQRLCPEVPLPSAEDEQADPVAADAAYGAYVDRLRVRVRDAADRFRVVAAANATYGFRRNLWAVKSWGIAAGLIAGMVAGAYLLHVGVAAEAVASLIVCVASLMFLIGVVEPDWVREAGFRYAHQLVECAEGASGDVSV